MPPVLRVVMIVAEIPRLYRGSGKTLAIREKEKEWAAGKKGEGSRSGQPMGRRRCGAASAAYKMRTMFYGPHCFCKVKAMQSTVSIAHLVPLGAKGILALTGHLHQATSFDVVLTGKGRQGNSFCGPFICIYKIPGGETSPARPSGRSRFPAC